MGAVVEEDMVKQDEEADAVVQDAHIGVVVKDEEVEDEKVED